MKALCIGLILALTTYGATADPLTLDQHQHNAQAGIVAIMGNVRHPCEIHVEPGEKLMLSEALLKAGGEAGIGSPTGVSIRRLKDGKVITLKVRFGYNDGKDHDFPLLPGDVVVFGSYPF